MTVLVALGLAATVTLGLFLIGRNVTPDFAAGLFGQHLTDAVRLKARLATVILGLAIVQLMLALWMYRRLPGTTRVPTVPTAVPRAHRAIGALAFFGTLPIAAHCIQTYGVELTPVRAAIHSLAACFFYGAFAAKLVFVHSRRVVGWLLPLSGGVLVVTVVVVWYTSALWFFDGFHVPGF
ncbi:DUF6529 family protein [Streptomyces sp. SP17BM10]|uniref:DUF6529 family protein n=1 Tax=Streptomyces sp. SP17BM10 TaxID=3002530 RepID=UPI002E7A0E4A|nr:DUF6529 family protein [Streptomyces sp. SP17BM10]MEE1782144.1 DUF6529 family protein [Streptomyces sp. SP17BM10]